MHRYYKLKMKFGKDILYGRLKLEIDKNNIKGTIEYKNIKTSFKDGILKDNNIEFSGNFKIFFSKVNYIAKGYIDDEKISIIATTNRGDFEINGIREKE